jgi:hypothetical protein
MRLTINLLSFTSGDKYFNTDSVAEKDIAI